jgi:large subunit ribosomal protein L18
MKRTNFRRRAQGVTDYRKRLGVLKSGKARLVVRKTNSNIIAQLVNYKPEGDNVLVTFDMVFLRSKGWKGCANTSAAYLIGYGLAKKAKTLKVAEAILDMGRHPRSSKIFALVKGANDGGLKIPISEDAVPSKERIEGHHVDSYMKSAKGNQFLLYKKNKVSVAENFKEVLSKVKGD